MPPLLGVVRILGGARLHIGHLLGVKVLMHAIIKKALQCRKLFHHMADLLILEARLHVDLMLMLVTALHFWLSFFPFRPWAF